METSQRISTSVIKSVFTAILILSHSATSLALDHTFYYGGRIVDSKGTPRSGSLEVSVNFFDAATFGNQLNIGTYGGMTTAIDGVFQIPVDITASDETTIYGSSVVWIEFTDRTNGTVYPRQRLNPVPYALRVPVDGSTIIFNTDGNLQVGHIALTQITGLSGLLASKADVASTGNMAMGAGATLALGSFNNAAQTAMVLTLGTDDAGKTWYNSELKQVMYFNGSSAQEVSNSGGSGGITTLNGLTDSVQGLGIGTSGNAPNWGSAAAVHTLNIPMSSMGGVAAGLLSNSDYSNFSSATTKSGYLTVTAAINLDTIRSAVAGATSSNSNLTLVQRDATGSLNAATITAETKLNLKSASTSNAISLAAPAGMATTTSYTLPAAPVAGALLTTDVAGNLSWISSSSVAPVTSVAGRTGAITLTTSDVNEGANQYFTAARAKSAAVVDALNSGVTDTAPSQNAVFTAISAVNTAISEKEPTISNPADTSKYYRGDKSWQTLDTAAVAENSNLYFTNARVYGALSGVAPINYSVASGAIGIDQATTITNGYLTAADWNIFNNKQAALGYTPVNKNGDGMTGALTLNAANELHFADTTSSHYVGFKAPSTVTANKVWVLPAGDGAPGQVLKTDGAGTLSWVSDSVNAGTVTSVATGTGLTGGPITGSGTINLANTSVTPNSYTRANITVDAQGRLTAASNAPAIVDADISAAAAISESKIANLTADLASKEGTITNPADTSKYYRGDKSWQTLNTAFVPEVTNLYYTDTRARLAQSAVAPISYNSSTGAISIAQANSGSSGFLSSGDWNSFNNKVSSQWSTSGLNLSYSAGNVGIGSAIPGYSLDINGGLRTSGEMVSTMASGNGQARYVYGNYGVIHRNDGGTYWLLLTNSGDPYGGWNSLRPLQVSLATGNTTMNNLVAMAAGNVGIGTSSPTQLLDVRGNIAMGDWTANLGSRRIGVMDSSGTTQTGGMEIENTTLGGNYSQKLHFATHHSGTSWGRRMTINEDGFVGIGSTTPPYQLTLSGGASTFGVENSSVFYAKNASGNYEMYMHPRWSDNVMYINYGSGGFNIRNNSATSTMFMTDSGLVGIGSPSPTQRLDVAGAINVTGGLTSSSGTIWDAGGGWIRTYGNAGWYSQTYGGGWYMSDANYMRVFNDKIVYSNGGALFGVTAVGTCPYGSCSFPYETINLETIRNLRVVFGSNERFTFGNDGAAYKPGGGGWSALSDIRTKNVIGPYQKGLKEIMALDTIVYKYKEDNPRQYDSTIPYVGFSAQEVQKVIPEAVKAGEGGYLQLDQNPIVWAMFNAIKELKQAQEQEKRDSQTQIQNLKTQNELLRAYLCAKDPNAPICSAKE